MRKAIAIGLVLIGALLLTGQGPWNILIGKRAPYSADNKFGMNEAVGTSFEDIWSNSGTFTYPSSAATFTIESASTDDDGDPVGTGARTVEVLGLDGNFAEITETITLDGTTQVTSSNSYLRINRMIVRTGGSTGSNVGIIQAKDGSANVLSEIPATDNQTLQTQFTVPAGKTMYIGKMFANVGKNDDAQIRMCIRPFGEVFQVKINLGIFQADTQHDFQYSFVVTEKSDIIMQGKSAGGGVTASAGWNYILRDN